MINKKTKMLGADFTSNLELGAKMGCMQDVGELDGTQSTKKSKYGYKAGLTSSIDPANKEAEAAHQTELDNIRAKAQTDAASTNKAAQQATSQSNDIAVFSKNEEDILRLASKLGMFEPANQANPEFKVESEDVKTLQKLLIKEGVKVAVDGVAKQDGETELGVMQIVRENATAIAGNYIQTVELLEKGHFKPKESPQAPRAVEGVQH